MSEESTSPATQDRRSPLAAFKAALEHLDTESLKGLATSLFIQTNVLEKYMPLMVEAGNREVAGPATGDCVVGITPPRNEDQRAAAQFFADNPSAALLALQWYLSRTEGKTPLD